MIFENDSNLKNVNSENFYDLVRKVTDDLMSIKKGFNSLHAKLKAVLMSHVKLLAFKA